MGNILSNVVSIFDGIWDDLAKLTITNKAPMCEILGVLQTNLNIHYTLVYPNH